MSTFTQDLPPAGGYEKVHYERNPCKRYFSAPLAIAGYVAVTAYYYYCHYHTKREIYAERHEQQSASNAITPFLTAERDRLYLKELRKNREIEAELMKNVPGWVVGTYYGKQRYMTKRDDQWIDPGFFEFYAHNAYEETQKRQNQFLEI